MLVKRATDNRLLFGVLAAGVGVIVVLVALAAGGGDETEPVSSFAVPCRLMPAWTESGTASGGTGRVGSRPPEIRVYLDTSHPMGGYLPPSDERGEAVFRAVTQLVPGHLVGRFSGTVRWFGVDGTLRPLDGDLDLTRALFNGGQTRLELALEDLFSALEAGQTEAAVLISDLVSTTGPEGAMGAVEPLLRWNRSAAVREGRYDLGLLAVRANYWGVTSSRCQGSGSLGCWYSEHANRYMPMSDVARRPLYFLFFGVTSKDGESSGSETSRVEAAGRSFQAALEELGLETRWELLSEASRGRSASLICSARQNDSEARSSAQFALVRNEHGIHQCRRDEEVLLSCCMARSAKGGGCDDGLELRSGRATWTGVPVRAKEAHLELVVDCGALRRKLPEKPLNFEDVFANVVGVESDPWGEWSARSDELEDSLNGTLQMDLFVDTVRLRPDHYRIHLQEPLLRFAPQ